ncbi:hypothetical protein [uncultured Sphingomonas sp.]|uniref:hypothetical protein n=1 Tax=uncultured Sphingomonas sp. TaxID=158754 RepID=UPI0025D616E8|nr:hypothetical protein [uncultured Sphingomonas sp.]
MTESADNLHRDLRARIADVHRRAERLSPLDIHRRMDAIRDLAAQGGLAAVEGLASRSAQLALLPGCRVTVQSCLAHMDAALSSGSAADRQTILAAVAVRLH